MINFKKRYIIYLILGVLASVLVIVKFDNIMSSIADMLTVSAPLFIALIIAYMLDRPVKFFQRHLLRLKKLTFKQARAIAIIFSYLLFIGLIVGLLFILIPQLIDSISEFLNNFRIYSIQFQDFFEKINQKLIQYHLDPSVLSNFNNQATSWINQIIQTAPHTISSVITSIATFFGQLLIGILVSIYLLVDKKRLLRQLRRVIELTVKPSHMPVVNNLMSLTNRVFSDFVYVQTTEALIVGSLIFVILSIFRFPFALMISTVCGMTVLVPVVGSLIGGAFGLLIMLFVSPSKAIGFIVIFFIVMQLDANLIYPHRVQRSISLPAVWAIISIILGGGLFGVLGALLAVPVTSIFYQLGTDHLRKREYYRKRQREINDCLKAEKNTIKSMMNDAEIISSESYDTDIDPDTGQGEIRHTVVKTRRESISMNELWQNFRALKDFLIHKRGRHLPHDQELSSESRSSQKEYSDKDRGEAKK